MPAPGDLAASRNRPTLPDVNDGGLPLRPFYTAAGPNVEDESKPGEFPFTRGLRDAGYRDRLWTMRQYAGFGGAEETNARFKALLAAGQTGLSTAFDLPTQMGLDSDSPLAAGEVGRLGVAIDTLADVERCFAGLPLATISTSMTINATAAILFAMYAVVGERQGVATADLAGTTQNDILKEFVARGTYIYPPRPSFRLAVDLMEHCARHAPKWNAISVSGYHIRDAGGTAAQEMAFAVANGVAYGDELIRRGLKADDFAPRISWIFNSHNDFFGEVAKFRALRRMWATIVRRRWGAKEDRACMLRTHVQTGGVTLQARQIEVNIVRAAYQAMAAALGGVQSMALSCHDEALALPTEFAQEIALRTQQVLALETGVAKVADPLGGSHYVEHLTREEEAEARRILERIDLAGGAVAAIEQGVMQRAIEESAYRHQREVERGERLIVGLNCYTETVKTEARNAVFQADPAVEREQRARLDKVRAGRDGGAVRRALAALGDAARGPDNLLPPIIDAVRAYASVGEISDALRKVFGAHRETRAARSPGDV